MCFASSLQGTGAQGSSEQNCPASPLGEEMGTLSPSPPPHLGLWLPGHQDQMCALAQ